MRGQKVPEGDDGGEDKHGMAAVKRVRWEEEEVLAYYSMMSLHQMFELVGSQLTQADVEALSFLLDEAYPLGRAQAEGARERPLDTGRLHRPKSGVRLLFELERRGLCDESSFGNLLQLLRVITRHDLLPYVGQKRGRAVSPERCTYGQPASGIRDQMESCLNSERANSTRRNWESGTPSNKQQSVGRRRRQAGGKRRGRKSNVPYNRKTTNRQSPQFQKATCAILLSDLQDMCSKEESLYAHVLSKKHRLALLYYNFLHDVATEVSDIRLRVRAVFSDQNSVLRGNVVSVKQDPLDRCFDLFGQANTILKSRDLGSIICDIKFSELSYLDAFWNDYINGSLLEALKGVFITDSLKQAVGQEVIRLLVNVDEDDYEEGRRILLQNISLCEECACKQDH
ncbi:death effector domain-containing 1 isoform X1 [Pristis pectinata]|uniref:death effector domain-containing 1 isoform X1 n=1 Tax=Pristis pectinata TaxID=685728 RepID=UPI00223C9A35|nr:death effector domain-containing 1 isoform X1 [Pristis pectinata]